MPTELDRMKKISKWTNKYGWKAYFDRENPWNYPLFHVKETNGSKPDILLKKQNYTLAIEMKNGKDHKELVDGFGQTLRYAGEYWTNKAQYTIQGKQQKINAFVLATQFSPKGHLYEKETEHVNPNNEYFTKNLEIDEKLATHELTRQIWRLWENTKAKVNLVRELYEEKTENKRNKPKVGALLAKIDYHTKEPSKDPWLFLNSNEITSIKYNNDIYALNKTE